jgi:toxin YhaV
MAGKDSGSIEDPHVENGWTLYAHPVFLRDFIELLETVEKDARVDEHGFQQHPSYKLLVKVRDCIKVRIPSDPNHADFRLDDTLGKRHSHWRRAKHGMPQRYRLFFLFSSVAPRSIIYAWFNDESTLRKAGSRSDCYAVFKRMLDKGVIPKSFDDLKNAATGITKGVIGE